jgi:hypothetical protein
VLENKRELGHIQSKERWLLTLLVIKYRELNKNMILYGKLEINVTEEIVTCTIEATPSGTEKNYVSTVRISAAAAKA